MLLSFMLNQINIHAVQEAFKNAGITEFTVAELTMLAQNDISLPEEAQAQFEKMIDALEDLEDVQQVTITSI